MPAVVLYTKSGCHLCDQARTMLVRSSPQLDFEEVDIASDTSLVSIYGERIPVLLRRDTGEELAWPFQPEQLNQFMR